MTTASIAKQSILHFWTRVNLTADDTRCWEWTGATNGRGYGQYRIRPKLWATHRFAWTVTNGDIPDDLCVLHKCDNPACCNPNHLFLGTHQKNMLDRDNKKRNPRGMQIGSSKLTESDVQIIWQRLKDGETPFQIAKTSVVTAGTIYAIKDGITWKHLQLA